MKRLQQNLMRIEGKLYPLYKQIKGVYTFPQFKLSIHHVQGDPFAQPSLFSIEVKNKLLRSDDSITTCIWKRIHIHLVLGVLVAHDPTVLFSLSI